MNGPYRKSDGLEESYRRLQRAYAAEVESNLMLYRYVTQYRRVLGWSLAALFAGAICVAVALGVAVG